MHVRPKQKSPSELDQHLLFLRAFLRRPKEVGSIVPSSRFLVQRILRSADVASARVVVELGPGTGGTTRALLRAMPPDARLLAIEINPRFAELLRTTQRDPRLLVHSGTAVQVGRALAEHGLQAPDVVLSGIPFSTIESGLGIQILQAVHDALAPGGRFVAYQVRDRVEKLGRRVFGPAGTRIVLRNVPPVRVYRWQKPALETGESGAAGEAEAATAVP